MQETWMDENTKKEVMLIGDLRERKIHSEVTSFTEETEDKLSELYDDDIAVVTSEYEKGKGFEVVEIVLVEEAIEEAFD